MKSKFFVAVLGLFFVMCAGITPLFAQKDVSGSDDAAELKETTLDYFLIDLRNGLIATGQLSGTPLYTVIDFWTQADLTKLLGAINGYFGASNGGYVLDNQVLQATATHSVAWSSTQSQFRIALSGAAQNYFGSKRWGLAGCSVKQITGTETDLFVAISQNVRCVFADFVRTKLLQASPDQALDLAFIQGTGVATELSNYLTTLQQAGHVLNFNIPTDLRQIDITLSAPSALNYITLSPNMVNPFASITDEASAYDRILTGIIDDTLLALYSNYDPFPVERTLLTSGLNSVIKSGYTAWDKRQTTFLATMGWGQPVTPVPAAPAPPPCTYGLGTVTPCNNIVAIYQGYDHNGFFSTYGGGFPKMESALGSLGYVIRQVVANPPPTHRLPWNESELMNAQTLIMRVHGGSSGEAVFQCLTGIAYNSVACCDALKKMAQRMGLPDANTMNCTGNPMPVIDPSGSLRIVDGCGGVANACMIQADRNLYLNLGTKAAVLTGQCYGGSIPQLVPNLGDHVMDFFGGSLFSNWLTSLGGTLWVGGIKQDDMRLSMDIKGEAQYCRNMADLTPNYWERWEDAVCSGPAYALYPNSPIDGYPFTLKTIQGSYSTRGAINPNSNQVNPCAWQYTAAGWRKYCLATMGGNAWTEVEFAPSLAFATFNPNNGVFYAEFTSEVKTGCTVDVKKSGSARFTLSTNKEYSSKSCSPSGVSVQLSGDPAWMSPQEWGRPDSELRAIYGSDKTNWPWYIRITINAAAPNGVKMIGNGTATKKWIWPDGVISSNNGPWELFNGKTQQGKVEIDIPVVPSMACCMPNVQFQSPPGGGMPTPYQNGCTCAGGVGKDFCFAGACVIPDGQGSGFPLTWAGMTAADCANMGGNYTRFNGTWHLWEDCCAVPNPAGGNFCEMTVVETYEPPSTCQLGDPFLSSKTWYQHIPRPWDTSGPAKCPPISAYGVCTEL